jgi:hypothetical protein
VRIARSTINSLRVRYIIQTVGEEGTDDANEWLSVDIGDVLEVS